MTAEELLIFWAADCRRQDMQVVAPELAWLWEEELACAAYE